MTAALVAPVQDSNTATTGLGLVEDATRITAGIRDGSWVDVSLGGVGATLEALSPAIDPIGALVGWGVGWLLEHLQPLRDALDQLAGDADEIAAHAATWTNIAARTGSARAGYDQRLRTDVAGWAGAAGDAYRAHAAEQLVVLDGISVASSGIAAAVDGTGLLVSMVRGIVRDLIADFVATLAVRLPQWLAMEGITLGFATPFVAGQVSSLVLEWVRRIRHFIQALLDSLRRLIPRTDRLRHILDQLIMRAEGLSRAGGRTGPDRAGTAPSLPPSPERRPRGRRTDAHPTAKDNQPLRRENEAADILVRKGYDIEQNPPTRENGKNPDYKIEGEYFDCYAPVTANAEKIRNRLSSKVHDEQADRLVLCIDDTPRSMDEVAAVLRRKPIADLKEILVVQDGEVIPFYPFGE